MPDTNFKRILPAASCFGRKSLCAVAIAAVFLSGAHAAGLGKLTVFSALGQPLQAEIELTTASASELSGLKVKLASADAFRQANIEFNPALSSLRFATEQRGGRQIIRVTSSQPINEPFVDLLLEIASPDSRLVREYTFLLDPADLKKNQPAQMAAAPAAAAPGPASNTVAPEPRGASAAEAGPRTATGSVPAASAQPQASVPRRLRRATGADSESAGGKSTVQVKPGDTLARIAGEVRQPGVSLDQMLVALQRANPDAFVGENMNRLRAGQILTVPGAEAVRALPPSEAREVVVAQASNFNEYRSKLAGQIMAGSAKPADQGSQSAAGKITARVEEQVTAANESKDKLKLSRAGVAGTGAEKAGVAANEDKIASDKALAEANSRVKELEKNVNELQKLLELKNKDLADKQKEALAGGATGGVAAAGVVAAAQPPTSQGAPGATPSGTSPGAPSAPVLPVPGAPAVSAAQPASNPSPSPNEAPAASSAQPAGDASGAPAAKPVARAPVTSRPAATASFMDDLMSNPLVLPISAAVLLLLGALGVRSARRRKAAQAYPETSLLEDSALKTNSLFGSTGGQSVDTNNSVFNSGFAPSASQLDTNEVDPVAEADVYIAYGRDAQAEEILKEALRTQAERPAVRGKLLEIYANRKDLRSFETVASELYSLSKGEGEEWRQAAILGHSLDPKNPLYAGGRSAAVEGKIATNPGASQSLDDLDLDALLNTTQTGTTQADSGSSEPHLQTLAVPTTFSEEDKDALPTLTMPLADPVEAAVDGGQSAAATASQGQQPDPAAVHSSEAAASRLATRLQEVEPIAPLNFDFDLEALGLNSDAVKAARATNDLPELEAHSLGMDFESFRSPPVTKTAEVDSLDSLKAAYSGSHPGMPGPQTLKPASALHAAEATHTLPPDFDLSDISLELDPVQDPELASSVAPAVGSSGHETSANAAEFATKLDLALAYEEIGDKEGAKELLKEVARGGHPELSEKARGLLKKLA